MAGGPAVNAESDRTNIWPHANNISEKLIVNFKNCQFCKDFLAVSFFPSMEIGRTCARQSFDASMLYRKR